MASPDPNKLREYRNQVINHAVDEYLKVELFTSGDLATLLSVAEKLDNLSVAITYEDTHEGD
ncbi:hypothetical protein AB0G00_23790 [Nocardia salmonicida]|uniref:hypothetical protein n=1 Tax=Nocardia salmonicida TaxID=53431 RepID=UPI0033E910EA